MRILHVAKKYPNALGGDATGSSSLEKEQIKNGNEVFILTTDSEGIIDKDNVIKFGLKTNYQDWDAISFKRLLSTLSLVLKSKKYIKEIKPNIVHSHSAELGYIMSFACRKYNIPIINQCRGVSFPYPERTTFLRRVVEKFCLKHGKFNKIITVDENSLDSFKEAGIEKVIYLPNGIDLDKFNLPKKTNKRLEILFVGRVETEKGVNELIEAVNMIRDKSPDFILKLLGDGKELNKFKEKVEKYSLQDKIKFLGKKNHEETIKEYFNSDIFILPSHQEGFPNTLLEALGASLPVIITDVGGISKVCTNNKDALIIPSRDTEAIKDAMIKLIENKEIRDKLGKNGRKIVEQKYTWKKVNKEIERIYSEVLVFIK